MGKLSTFITRLKQTLTKIGEDVKDLRDNKADVSDIPDVSGLVPYTGATENVDLNEKTIFFEGGGISRYTTNSRLVTNIQNASFNTAGIFGISWVSPNVTYTSIKIIVTNNRNSWTFELTVSGYWYNGLWNSSRDARGLIYASGNVPESILSNVKLCVYNNNPCLIFGDQTDYGLGTMIHVDYIHQASSGAVGSDTAISENWQTLSDITLNDVSGVRDVSLTVNKDITDEQIDNWDTAYGWGDYSADRKLWKYVRILTANDNLNDLRDIGIYQTSATASATPANNYPVQAAGILRVYSSGTVTSTHIIQEYTRYNGNRTVFKRYYYNGTWSSWSEFWDSNSFNPAQYVQQSALNTQLNNYATKAGTQTFTGQNTFTQAPIVPNGTLNGHTVNLGQLNDKLGEKADIDGSNTIGGSWNIDELGSTAIGSYSTVYALDNSVVGINPTNSLGVSPGILLMKQGFPIVIAENENPDWDGYLYRAGTPLDGYPGNQQNGNYLIESKHRFRLHTITAPDSTSGGVGSLQINPFNGIEHNYFRVTISSVDSLDIFIKEPYRDEITDHIIERNAIGQKCTVAVSGSLALVKFNNVSGADFTSEWNKGVFEFYWTGTGWMFGGYSPIKP